MTMRKHSWLLVCAVLFPALMLDAAGARASRLSGLDVYVRGQHAYVADFADGIFAVAIRDPGRPQIVGSVNTPGRAQGVYALYDLLFVADGSRGLQLIDIRSPGSLRIISSHDTPGKTHSVYGLASRVFIGGSGFGLGIFDVIDRSRLSRNGHLLIRPDR
jgi:hypothetical protein